MNADNTISEQDDRTVAASLASLTEIMDRLTRVKRKSPITAYPALAIFRHESPTELTSYMQEPSICLIAQGNKRVLLGEDEYFYDQRQYLLTSIDLPLVAQIIAASRQKPYLGLTLKLERKNIAQMMLDNDISISRSGCADRCMAVSKLTPPIVQAVLRLLDLLDHPEDIPVLAPLIQKEILYRLLIGEQGHRLRQIVMTGSYSHQIARAIDWLKENYSKTFKINDLAAHIGMSVSSLHYHFRAMTAMSPLQFQKKLRLNVARQLMFMEQKDATTAAFEVGYESPSQFSREYSRMFGAPPSRDIKRLLETATNW